jgi:hypothetical protein
VVLRRLRGREREFLRSALGEEWVLASARSPLINLIKATHIYNEPLALKPHHATLSNR